MLLKRLTTKVEISKIKKEQVYFNDRFETLIVSVEKGLEIPAQPAPADASLYVISGNLVFDIEGKVYTLEADDFFSFQKDQMHSVKALNNSKFIISRNLPEK